jgi:hypothetical protein
LTSWQALGFIEEKNRGEKESSRLVIRNSMCADCGQLRYTPFFDLL